MSREAYEVIAPSNIALIKYWGKIDENLQWPANDSLSMTLTNSTTKTSAWEIQDHEDHFSGKGIQFDKARRHLDFLRSLLGFQSSLSIETSNSFPTGCGIASSASGMCALTLAAISCWTKSKDLTSLEANGFDRPRLAELSRMGSGSACRSIFGGIVEWKRGETASDQKVQVIDEWPLCDTIVICDGSEKSVSSTQGHRLAWTSPLFKLRLAGLEERAHRLKNAIKARDIHRFGEIIEADALEMHAIMMTSQPAVHYFGDATKEVLTWIRKNRDQQTPFYFTLDAGPNVHILSTPESAPVLREKLRSSFPNLKLIEDEAGSGPTLTKRGTSIEHQY